MKTPAEIVAAEVERRRLGDDIQTPVPQRSQVLDRLLVTQIMAEYEPLARVEQQVEGAMQAARAAQSHAMQLQGAVAALVKDINAESTRNNNFYDRIGRIEKSVGDFGLRLDADAIARKRHADRIKVAIWTTGAAVLASAMAVWKFVFNH